MTRAALLALLLLAACGRSGEPGGPARFVLVTIDTLRADRLGCYGAENAATPTLDALAARGVRFETAIAPTPLTLPSHATLLTALDPPEHGVRSNGRFRLHEGVPTLAERLSDEGFATAAFVSAFVLDRRFGLARGFDVYDDALGVNDRELGIPARRADQTVDAALRWLDGAPERFFLWLHLYDPHAPYEPPEPHRARLLGRAYEGEIAFADAELGRLLAALDARFPAGGTVVVVTADHGESLGEHGEPTHAFTLYDATQRVPLLMAGPGLPPGVVVSRDVARLADVAPSLLELAGAPALSGGAGRSLLPLVRGEPEPEGRVAWVETLATQLDFGWSPLLGVRTRDHKYVRAPRPELYALATDPEEERNLATEQPELAAELDALVSERNTATQAAPNFAADPEVIERLRALGYVAGSSAGSPRPLGEVGGPDPKDEIGKLEAIHEALALHESGEERDAFDRLVALGELGLELELVRGQVALAVGELESARASAERARRQAPGEAGGLLLLGGVDEAEGRLADAEAAFRGALELDPAAGQAVVGLGRVAEARGRTDEALASYERSRQLAPIEAEGLWRLAALEIERGRPDAAQAVLAVLPPRLARSPAAAARLASAERLAGRLDLATLRLQGALREHPDAPELRLAKADVLEDRGRPAAALAVRRKAHEKAPWDRSAGLALARSLALAGRELDLALELAEAEAARARSGAALEALAVVHVARREFAAAAATAEEGLAGAPARARPYLLLVHAEALAGLGQPEAAREALREARAAAGADPRAARAGDRVERLLGDPR